jgi:hypothetical protein
LQIGREAQISPPSSFASFSAMATFSGALKICDLANGEMMVFIWLIETALLVS